MENNGTNTITLFQQFINSLNEKTKQYIYKRSTELSIPCMRIIGLCYLFQNYITMDIMLDDIFLNYCIPNKRPWNHFYNPINYVYNSSILSNKPLHRLMDLIDQRKVLDMTIGSESKEKYPRKVIFSSMSHDEIINKTTNYIKLTVSRYGDLSFDHYLLIEYIVKDKINWFQEIKQLVNCIILNSSNDAIYTWTYNLMSENKDMIIYQHKENANQYWISTSCICTPFPLVAVQLNTLYITFKFNEDVHIISHRSGYLFYPASERRYLAHNSAVAGSFKDNCIFIIKNGFIWRNEQKTNIVFSKDVIVDGNYKDYIKDNHLIHHVDDPLFKTLCNYDQGSYGKHTINSFIYD